MLAFAHIPLEDIAEHLRLAVLLLIVLGCFSLCRLADCVYACLCVCVCVSLTNKHALYKKNTFQNVVIAVLLCVKLETLTVKAF